jgi:hypothetical protein
MCDHPLCRMIARRLLGCHILLCLAGSLLLLSTTSPALAVDRRSFAYVANSRSNSVSISEINTATGDGGIRVGAGCSHHLYPTGFMTERE